MRFNDDDLKRQKDNFIGIDDEAIVHLQDGVFNGKFENIKLEVILRGLLARLKASEKIHRYARHFKMCKGIHDTCVCGFSNADDAYRKASGK